MSLFYGLSLAFNVIVAALLWYIKKQCEQEPYIKQKLNAFIQALLYDGEE